MLEMHLRQSGFTDSAFGPFTTNKERIQRFKETGDCQYFYQNELDKVCFQLNLKKKQNFMATASRLEPLRGGSLLFTTTFQNQSA